MAPPKKAAAPKTAPPKKAAAPSAVDQAENERAAEQQADLHLSPAPAVEKPVAKAPAPQAPKALPVSVTLDAPYAYYGDDGQFYAWSTGSVVTDKGEIRDLYERGAPVSVTPE